LYGLIRCREPGPVDSSGPRTLIPSFLVLYCAFERVVSNDWHANHAQSANPEDYILVGRMWLIIFLSSENRSYVLLGAEVVFRD